MRILPSSSKASAASRSASSSAEHARAHAPQLGDELVVDRVVDHERLLCRADERRVEGLGDQDVDHRHRDVGAGVQVDRGVAGPHAEAGLARLVGRRDGLRPTGGPDEVDAGMVEEVLRDLERRVGHDLQRVRRQPGLLAGRLQQVDRALRAAGGPRRRAEDDGVARLGRHDRLEQGGRGRVGDRQQREDDADGLGDVLDPAFVVLVDDPDRLLVLEVVEEELGRDVVLDHLVLEHAEARLLHGQLGEVDRVLQAGDDHRPHDAVDRLLVEAAQRACRLLRTVDHLVEARVRRS